MHIGRLAGHRSIAPGMPAAPDVTSDRALTRVEWLICTVAGLGFAFDLYESLMTALIVGPSLTSLGHLSPGTADFNLWVGLFFFVPVVTGGLCGLLGGYLTDVFGRRRVLVWSILLYSVSAAAAAYATSLTTLLLLRCATLAGVCVEAVAAVAWIAELFPVPARREKILGYTQACYPVGGILVSSAYYLAVTYGDLLPEIRGSPRCVALHAVIGVDSRVSVDRPSALPAGVPSLAVAARRRHVATSPCGRAVSPGPARQDRCDRARRRVHAGDPLCSSPTHAAYRARHCRTRGHVPA